MIGDHRSSISDALFRGRNLPMFALQNWEVVVAVQLDKKADAAAPAREPKRSAGARFVETVRDTAPRADVTGMSSSDFKAKILGRKPE